MKKTFADSIILKCGLKSLRRCNYAKLKKIKVYLEIIMHLLGINYLEIICLELGIIDRAL